MQKITVIIVTYNAMKWAKTCFASLRNSSIPLHTIVVDNASTDETVDFIKNNFPEVELVESRENLGFGKANNLGIELAYKNGADFFYLMNQDAWLFPDTVKQLLEVYENYEPKSEIGILSPIHVDGTEKKLDIFIDKYLAQNFENRFISDAVLGNLKLYYELNFINAAHWFLPKKTIEEIGGFNPYFYHYGEDNEYVNRLHFHKKKVILATKSRAVHDGKQELDKVDYQKYENLGIEVKIMNPAIPNAPTTELRELKKSIFKNTVVGNFGKAKKLSAKKNKIEKEITELTSLRNLVSQKHHHFLNL